MDYGSRYTDKRERILDLRLQKVYREAQKDLEEKFESFLKSHREKGAEMWDKLKNGEITKDEYSKWMKAEVLKGKEWKKKIDLSAEMLKLTNEKALTIIRGEQLNVFSENANFTAYQTEKNEGFSAGISFEIYDVPTIDRLISKKPELLPRKKLNGRKDKAWNQGVIANAVTQAIIQGESINDLAKRLAKDTASTDMKAMNRYARTAMTGAQNAGRMETLYRSVEMGIRVKKRWLATLDSRTRDSHAALDGSVVDVDEKFSNGLEYPGDPHGSAAEVCNCRCTLTYVYEDIQDENAKRRDNETGEIIEDMTYEEWKERKKDEKDKKALFEDDTDWFKKDVKPGRGKVDKPEKNISPDYRHELDIAKEILKTYGGYVEMLDQRGNKKVADYKWKGLEWELKKASSKNAVEKRTKEALEKMKFLRCEIMIDVQMDRIELAKEVIRKTIEKYANRSCKVLVLNYGEIVGAWKYNKRRQV